MYVAEKHSRNFSEKNNKLLNFRHEEVISNDFDYSTSVSSKICVLIGPLIKRERERERERERGGVFPPPVLVLFGGPHMRLIVNVDQSVV